jgi:hypothetical protein
VDRRYTEVAACEATLPKGGVEDGNDYPRSNGVVFGDARKGYPAQFRKRDIEHARWSRRN